MFQTDKGVLCRARARRYRLRVAEWGGFWDVGDRSKSRIVNGKPAILRLWKRRDVKLVFLGLVLVALTQWSFLRMNPAGEVTLEFVEIVTRGRGVEEGTLAKFRLRNESGGEITYFGKKVNEPHCDIQPMVSGAYAEGGAVFYRPGPLGTLVNGDWWSKFTVMEGKEVMVYACVGRANGPWRLTMDYNMDAKDWWYNYVPQRFHKWFLLQPELGREMEVVSEAVDIKVRGLDIKQKTVLAHYQMFTASWPKDGITVVTNVDGSFGLKQVAR